MNTTIRISMIIRRVTITIMRAVEEEDKGEAPDEDGWRNALSDIFTVVLSVLLPDTQNPFPSLLVPFQFALIRRESA